jgi:hypothetical protein
LAILTLAVTNGFLREAVLLPNLNKPVAFATSGILLSILIVVVAVLFFPWLKLRSESSCLAVGALWLGLTLVFEFGLGGFVQGRSLSEMMEAYTFKDGNLWPLVLVVTFFAPLVAFRLRRKAKPARTHKV